MNIIIGAIIAWVIITCCAAYLTVISYRITIGMLALMGRLEGEAFFFYAVAILFWTGSWYLWPFQMSLKALVP